MITRVLVVDDDAAMRRLVVLLLNRDPRFEVVAEAVDGLEALERVEADEPDLILLDLAMPRMDGLQVLEALDETQRARVVVLTGFSDDDLHRQVLMAGAVACLQKGRDFARLVDLLATVGAEA